MASRQQRRQARGSATPLAALLGSAGTSQTIVVTRSVADAPSRWAGVDARVVDDGELAKTLRGLETRATVIALREPDEATMRVLDDRMPELLIIVGRPAAAQFDALEALALRQRCALLGPDAALRIGPAKHEDHVTPLACAATPAELTRLCAALGATRLAIAPTPAWLPRWLNGPLLLAHDIVGYVPREASSTAWLDWLEALGPRELRQLLVPLGVVPPELQAEHPGLEATLVAQRFERGVGPLYPAPQVLSLLREACLRSLDSEAHPTPEPSPLSAGARALWTQARRALPEYARGPRMREPDPGLSLRVPTAAFLAQRGLRRLEVSAALLASEFEEPEFPEPELLERADIVLEGAGEVLSDHESKVVLRGHGIEVTRQAFANSASGAASFADKIGYPVVLKGLSPELLNKRDIGAIELDVINAAAAKRAYAKIVANVEQFAPTVQLDGVAIAEQVEPGLDLRCGGLRLMSGGVGLYAQTLQGSDAHTEAKLARSPLSPTDALLLAEAALTDAPASARRRTAAPDVEVLAQLLMRIDGLFQHTGERLASVDLTPVRLIDSERLYVTLDARIIQRPHLEGA